MLSYWNYLWDQYDGIVLHHFSISDIMWVTCGQEDFADIPVTNYEEKYLYSN